MKEMDAVQKRLLKEVADLHDIPEGAYNFRANGESVDRRSTKNIEIESKTDKSGIDIRIKSGTKNESVPCCAQCKRYQRDSLQRFLHRR